MLPLSARSALRPSCKISFNTCVDCGVLFAARNKSKKLCHICADPTKRSRVINGLNRHKRKCLNPSCGIEFETYNIKQFACGVKCSNIVAGMRRKYERKLRAFLSICPNCGADAFEHNTCNDCFDKIDKSKNKKRRSALKESGMCQECGKNEVNDGRYRCDACLELMRLRNGAGVCSTDGCNNVTDYNKRICNECLELREARKQVCKVYFIECPECNKLFTSRYPSTPCCDDCKAERLKRLNTERNRRVKGLNLITKKCAYYRCNNTFTTYNTNKTTCSDLCSKRLMSRTRNQRERITRNFKISNDRYIERVSLKVLFFRDGGRCQICGKKLNLIRPNNHPLQATRDHIIPLSQGGEHSYKNTQLACRQCNSNKRDGAAPGGDQLLLFGR